MSNYVPVVASVENFQPIKGADFIVSATVRTTVDIATAVVSKDTVEGSIGLYFYPDTKLDQEYAQKNDLIARFDETGKKIGGGYFDSKLRVRAQKFKGIRSEGIWMPLSSISYTGTKQEFIVGELVENIVVGDKTYVLGSRYYIQQRNINTSTTAKKVDLNTFLPKHVDTEQLAYHIKEIPEGALITITEKYHGTSHRFGHVYVERPQSWWKNILSKFLPRYFPKGKYELVHGSRNVVLDGRKEGYHGSDQFRFDLFNFVKLEKDMVVYGEVVGYANDKPIMPPQDTSKYKDLKSLPSPMIYNYKLNNECEFIPYRITKEGKDLSHEEVREWAIKNAYPSPHVFDEFTYDGNSSTLLELAKKYAEGDKGYVLTTNGDHISEGVVVRVDYEGTTSFYKYKSFWFKVLEGIIKDEGIVDMEEEA
jgi:RNA ligase